MPGKSLSIMWRLLLEGIRPLELAAVISCDALDGPDDGSDWEEITPVYFNVKSKNQS